MYDTEVVDDCKETSLPGTTGPVYIGTHKDCAGTYQTCLHRLKPDKIPSPTKKLFAMDTCWGKQEISFL